MNARQKPILDITQLTIVRDGTRILDGVSWRVDPGQHWVIIGANGSGKTSLLSALTGYLIPTSGEMELLGCRFGESDWRELRCRIGLVSSSLRQMMADSEPALLSVVGGRYAMIDFWGDPTSSDQKAARKLLDLVEAGYLTDRPWAVLSQGERQRVLIARALMAKPRLLILDEPCAGLDPVAREHFLQFLNRLSAQPGAPSLVLVTHHVEEITPVFTHALLLRSGQVIAAGPRKTSLRSETLSRMFASPVRLRSRAGRLALEVQAHTAQAM